jgi:hypothetical protein
VSPTESAPSRGSSLAVAIGFSVADQLADGSRFRSLTVVDILGLTFF